MYADDYIPNVLVVDDDEDFARLLERTLSSGGYQVTCTESGEGALELLAESQYDLILLDINMPGLDGFETCRRIKASPTSTATPVLFMTAEGRSNEMLAQAISAGCCDYLTKPLSREDVLARVRNKLRRRIESQWFNQGDARDELTGLPGRNYFKSRLGEELCESVRFNSPISLVMAELDGFDEADDECGTLAGEVRDTVVSRFGLLLDSESRRHDVVARLAESCFGLLLPRVSLQGAATAARRMADIWRLTTSSFDGTEFSIPAFFATEGYDGASPPPSSGDLLKRALESIEHVRQAGTTTIGTPSENGLLLPTAGFCGPDIREPAFPAW